MERHRETVDELRSILRDLIEQIEMGNLRDDLGHDFKMNAAFLRAKEARERF